MKTIHNIHPAALIFTLLVLVACNRKDLSTGASEKKGTEATRKDSLETQPDTIVELTDQQVKEAGIVLGAIEDKPMGAIIKASGVVAVPPGNRASICSPWSGFVRNNLMLPGSQVRQGQVLATIENPEFIDMQQNYLEALSKLEFAEADYARHKQLHADDVYSTQNLQQVTSDYKSLKTQVSALAKKLRLIGIDPDHLNDGNISQSIPLKAPISGFIREIYGNNGKFVTPSDVLFEIVSNENLVLELTLYEKDMNQVSVGQEVEFFLNNETEAHHAEVKQVARAISAEKSFKIYATVRQACSNLLPGMYVGASITAPGSISTAVPSDALVRFNEKNYIFIFNRSSQENGKSMNEYSMVEVVRGKSSGNYTGIILPSWISHSSKIVVKGAFQLMAAKKNAGEMSC